MEKQWARQAGQTGSSREASPLYTAAPNKSASQFREAGRNELEQNNKKNKSFPATLVGSELFPTKAVCSSFPEGNGDLNREWCVYACKLWVNATMTGAPGIVCLVGIAWRSVYMETREVVIGAAMMSSPGPRANIGHVCNHHWDTPKGDHRCVCVCVLSAAVAMLPHVSVTGNVASIKHRPTYMH
ncbi:unnamed protein product [Clonostachys solani]|uniref:Uncharacterized protein n=1 Tax=Clonostachys solani TaxID=160281 RepID=A0A9P0EQA7_9HYPO|nr:unnamed protein product [Clonostachys solani]